jgi:large subunit ribosomal protein L4
MKLSVLSESGKKTNKSVDLSDTIFKIEPHDHAIWLDVRVIRANQRQGTHATKGRSEVSGGGRKPFRQKGTGRARQGTIRAPHHKGGGTVFGPHPRNYGMGINKKVKLLARKSALSYKAKSDDVIIVEDFSYDQPKTKRVRDFLTAFDLNDKKVLLVTGKNDTHMHNSARNLYNVQVRESVSFSTYDILNAEKLVIQESAAKKINEVLG